MIAAKIIPIIEGSSQHNSDLVAAGTPLLQQKVIEEGHSPHSAEMITMPFTAYRNELNDKLRTGDATEPTYYAALARLLQGLDEGIVATEHPRHVIGCGAPDIAVKRGPAPIGYVECKDIGANLDKWEKDEQLARYRDALPNLILTDYLEFRWYVEGELRGEARLGRQDSEGKVHTTREGQAAVQELLKCFLRQEPPIAATAQQLARYMAGAAQMIRSSTEQALAQEAESGSLHGMLQAFEETLIPDLDPGQFADMYAQTIAYGLFSARFELYRRQPAVAFTRGQASEYLPKTNPFLRKLFFHITGPDMPQEVAWMVDELAELLQRADMSEIGKDFARRPGREDPVVHFYEDFLREYDPKEKRLRGVYYTPEPVVKYIVRSIDYLLKEKFGKPLGLADEDVYILDPACGTGTFLYFVIDQIYKNVCEERGQGAWKAYVQERLLWRVFGFELLMAPYTIAHMKLSIQLSDLGYEFTDDERLGIYLTNSLEEAIELAEGQLRLGLQRAIAEESEAAGDIKRTKPIMVVLSNPPYAGHSANRGTWISGLLRDYRYVEGKRLEERTTKWLQDDYVKFIRFAQWRIEKTGQGIAAYITNRGYLDNPTFRGMRWHLMRSFEELYLWDLHGGTRERRADPTGQDENIFQTEQGVAIGLFVKLRSDGDKPSVCHHETWGTAAQKLETLVTTDVATTPWHPLDPRPPMRYFMRLDPAFQLEYELGVAIGDLFGGGGMGITTARDEFAVEVDRRKLVERLRAFASARGSDGELHERFKVPKKKGWHIRRAWTELNALTSNEIDALPVPVLYRPFDVRWICWRSAVVWRPVKRLMTHMHQDNLALITIKRSRQGISDAFYISEAATDKAVISSVDNAYVFPLYLYPEEGTTEAGRRANLNPKFVKEFAQKLGLTFIPDGQGNLGRTGVSPVQPNIPTTAGDLVRRRRHLPHWEQGGATYFITFRLQDGELNNAEREIILSSCRHWHGKNYRLYGAVVMPDHVHLLVQPLPIAPQPTGETPVVPTEYYSLAEILHSIKSYTAHAINKRRGTTGSIWVEESFDRIVRDQAEFDEKLHYILNNPVKAGLVGNGFQYPYLWYEGMSTQEEHLTQDAHTGATDERFPEPTGGTPVAPQHGTFGPEDVFYYAYAVFHSPTYRERYAEFLKIDFPRLPLTSDKDLFAQLVEKGQRLADLHLVREDGQVGGQPRFEGEGNNEVEKVRYVEGQGTGDGELGTRNGNRDRNVAPTNDKGGRVYINKKQYFDNIEPEVWEFHIGGYQVCHKWLKDRKGRQLSYNDIIHYQRIVLALRETISLMEEIDGIIPGWPME